MNPIEWSCLVSEQVRGVEPLSLAWKAKVIPIYDTRNVQIFSKFYVAETFKFFKIYYVLQYIFIFENSKLVGVLGLEPRLNRPKRFVLPLHHTPFSLVYKIILTEKIDIVKGKIL